MLGTLLYALKIFGVGTLVLIECGAIVAFCMMFYAYLEGQGLMWVAILLIFGAPMVIIGYIVYSIKKDLSPKNTKKPMVLQGEMAVTWDDDEYWTFSSKQYSYKFEDPKFDFGIFNKIGDIEKWIDDHKLIIEGHLKQELKDWNGWDGKYEILVIQIAKYCEDVEFSISYCHPDDNWGDLGIDINVKNGKVESVDSGD